MAGASELVILSAGSALINATYAAQHKHSVAGSVVSSGIAFVGLSFLGGVWRTDVAVAIAGLFFFAALVMRGLPLINSVSSLPTWSKDRTGGGTF